MTNEYILEQNLLIEGQRVHTWLSALLQNGTNLHYTEFPVLSLVSSKPELLKTADLLRFLTDEEDRRSCSVASYLPDLHCFDCLSLSAFRVCL